MCSDTAEKVKAGGSMVDTWVSPQNCEMGSLQKIQEIARTVLPEKLTRGKAVQERSKYKSWSIVWRNVTLQNGFPRCVYQVI